MLERIFLFVRRAQRAPTAGELFFSSEIWGVDETKNLPSRELESWTSFCCHTINFLTREFLVSLIRNKRTFTVSDAYLVYAIIVPTTSCSWTSKNSKHQRMIAP